MAYRYKINALPGGKLFFIWYTGYQKAGRLSISVCSFGGMFESGSRAARLKIPGNPAGILVILRSGF